MHCSLLPRTILHLRCAHLERSHISRLHEKVFSSSVAKSEESPMSNSASPQLSPPTKSKAQTRKSELTFPLPFLIPPLAHLCFHGNDGVSQCALHTLLWHALLLDCYRSLPACVSPFTFVILYSVLLTEIRVFFKGKPYFTPI